MVIKTSTKEGSALRKINNNWYSGAGFSSTMKGCLKNALNQRIKTTNGMINKVAGCCDLKKRIIGVKSRKIIFHLSIEFLFLCHLKNNNHERVLALHSKLFSIHL